MSSVLGNAEQRPGSETHKMAALYFDRTFGQSNLRENSSINSTFLPAHERPRNCSRGEFAQSFNSTAVAHSSVSTGR